MPNKEFEQWYSFCGKCDKYIKEQKSSCYRHICKNDVYWPILEYRLICDDVNYHYNYVFNIDDYEYVKQFVDDDECIKEMFLRARNNGEGEYMI